jgi:hypothetical protein
MLVRLNVANLAPEVTPERLTEMFAVFGTIEEAVILINQRTGNPRQAARININIDSEETLLDLLRQANGYVLEGRRIYVTPFAPPNYKTYDKQERADADAIAKQLEETEKQPRYQLLRMRKACGMSFMEALLDETLSVEENGGIMTVDMSRRRTTGGVYFFLARRYLSVKVRRSIFNVPFDRAPASQKGPQPKGKPAGKPGGAKPAGKPGGKPAAKPAGKPRPQQQQPRQPAPAPVNDAALEAARAKLAELHAEYEIAQRELEELKTKPREAQQTGLFSATRKVVNIQREISNLLRDFPQLEK